MPGAESPAPEPIDSGELRGRLATRRTSAKQGAPKAAKTSKTKTPKAQAAPTANDEQAADETTEEPEGGDGDGVFGESDIDEPIEVTGEVVEEADEPVEAGETDDDEERPRKRSTAAERDEDGGTGGGYALSRSDPLQAYLREVQRHPLLTPEQEKELATKYASTQDVNAARKLVTSNLRLVVKIAYEYRRAYKNIMDLIQEGNIGLMQAVKKYDPNRGVKLSSYSAWWIRAYILRFIINNWRLVKLGTTQAQRKLFFNLNKEKAKLAAMGIDPTPAEVAKRLGVEEQEAMDMDRRLSSGEMSLDAPVGDTEGRAVSRIELLPSATSGPDSMVADEQVQHILKEKLGEFRKTLKGKDIDIFDRRLVAEDPLTLQELGDQFGISRERVRQIEARLTMNLRNYLRDALGDAMVG